MTAVTKSVDCSPIWECLDMGAEISKRYGRETLDGHLASVAREYRGVPLPRDVKRGEPRMCFVNAYRLADEHPELGYCEGYSLPGPGFSVPFLHAWCVTPEGEVIDNTWDRPENNGYVGVVLDPAYVRSVFLRTHRYSVLGNLWMVSDSPLQTLVLDQRFGQVGRRRHCDETQKVSR